MDEVRELFPEPEFAEAAGVLEVISNNPEQIDNYISRLKYQLDDVWRLESTRSEALNEGRQEGRLEGRIEGLKEGEQKGELIGRIETLQEILGLAKPTRDELSGYDATQLVHRFGNDLP